MTLEPGTEQMLTESVRDVDGVLQFIVEPALAQQLQAAIQREAQGMTAQGKKPVLLTAPRVRPHLSYNFV